MLCPKCNQEMVNASVNRGNSISHHHLKPKRVFGNQGVEVILCRDCHTLLEKAIQCFERNILQKYAEEYEEVYYQFIGGDNGHLIEV